MPQDSSPEPQVWPPSITGSPKSEAEQHGYTRLTPLAVVIGVFTSLKGLLGIYFVIRLLPYAGRIIAYRPIGLVSYVTAAFELIPEFLGVALLYLGMKNLPAVGAGTSTMRPSISAVLQLVPFLSFPLAWLAARDVWLAGLPRYEEAWVNPRQRPIRFSGLVSTIFVLGGVYYCYGVMQFASRGIAVLTTFGGSVDSYLGLYVLVLIIEGLKIAFSLIVALRMDARHYEIAAGLPRGTRQF